MTTAELGLITTAVVGVSAAAAPTLTAWWNRAHERSMARSGRLYEQRRATYEGLGVFLERERMRMNLILDLVEKDKLIEDLERREGGPVVPPAPTNEEWTDLLAGVAVRGSTDVGTKVTAYHDRILNFYSQLGRYMGIVLTGLEGPEYKEHADKLSPEEVRQLVALHEEGILALDLAEEAMREELATI